MNPEYDDCRVIERTVTFKYTMPFRAGTPESLINATEQDQHYAEVSMSPYDLEVLSSSTRELEGEERQAKLDILNDLVSQESKILQSLLG